MDTQLADKPIPIDRRHETDARRTFADPPASFPGRTNALTLDEVVSEGQRRARLYRSASRGDYRGRAEAIEEFLHWIEAAR